ncbi:MAG TPA: type I restriction enzyme HsdR N-terminal domain-containing protein [Hanamia sp.]
MIKIEFPKDNILIQQREGINEIFDTVRKKWIVMSPEEWVRQNMLQYLLIIKKYPRSLMAVEKEIKLGELKKRCDIVIYNRQSQPWMIIECKEMNVNLSQKTIAQILRYHITLQSKFLIITNGSYSYGFEKKQEKFVEINTFPDFEV